MTAENEEKKVYLERYRTYQKRVARLSLELKELKAGKLSPSSAVMDGMPKGGTSKDLSSYMAAVDEIEQQILQERYQAVMAYENIRLAIERMENETEKDLLYYRYVDGRSFCWIADRLGYSYRNILYLHGSALNNFQMI